MNVPVHRGLPKSSALLPAFQPLSDPRDHRARHPEQAQAPRARESPDRRVDVSVLVPVRDEARVIGETAQSILAQRFDGAVEFLMIDGGSRDGTRAIIEGLAQRDQRVTILDNPRGDLASALRIGLEAARGEFVAKFDAHTHFPMSYLQCGVDRLRRGDVNWVSGPAIPTGTNRFSRLVALALGTRLGVGGSRKWSSPDPHALDGVEKDLDTGVFSGIWRRSVLERLGGWQQGWPVNEDSELASRFIAAGERIVCLPSMGAHYIPRESVQGLSRQYFRYGYYRVKTARHHPASMRPSHLAPPLLLGATALSFLGGRRMRTCMRLGPAAYLILQAVVCARVARTRGSRDAVLLPAVLTTMHASFGAGYLAGCLRYGPPIDALRMLGRRYVQMSMRAPECGPRDRQRPDGDSR
jgi:succinoglycan biosynthesis protein ExoA